LPSPLTISEEARLPGSNPLVAPTAALAFGILTARVIVFQPNELLFAIAAFLLLTIAALRSGSKVLGAVCCSLGFFSAGALTAVAHAPTPSPELDVEGREIVILAGCVVEPPAISGERERFILELEPHARAQVTLYAREGETLPALRYGQNIEADVRVRKPRNFQNPGAFDYTRYLARQEVYWTASGAASDLRVLPGSCGSPFWKAVMDLRHSALRRIESLYPNDPYKSGMMQAILIGQTYQLQKVWTEQYRSTGTFHALVISGTHVAVLAGFFLFLLRICLVPKGFALTLTVLASWLYALVTGWQAPCVRAAAGMTLYTIGRYFYRERRPMNLIAAVAMGFLLLDPEQLFEASFQLTFLAVGFLAAFAVPLIEATSGPLAYGLRGLADVDRDVRLAPRVAQFRIEMRLLSETIVRLTRIPQSAARLAVAATASVALFLFEVVAVSGVVQIGLALPMVAYFHRVGISGLSANAFVVPAMSLLVPLGFMAVFTGWTWIAKLAGAVLGLSEWVVRWHAAMEPNWRIPTPPVWLATAIAGAMVAAAMVRGRGWRITTGAAVAGLLTLLFWEPFPPVIEPGQLEMTTIDVGQGDSILMAFPDGKLLLVDGGGIASYGHTPRRNLDTGEDVVAPYLWDRRFRKLDAIAVSHAHEDHIGGLTALVAGFRPAELWTGATPDSPTWRTVREEALRRGARIIPMTAPHRFSFGGAEVEVLAPLPGYVPSATPRNNDSLVLRVRYGRHSFLLPGDVERQVESRLLAENELERDDVLKVAHHGSRTSTTEDFLNAVAPMFAVISAGYGNSYGHPHPDIVARLERHGVVALRTDQHGLITIRSDGRRLDVKTHNGFLSQR
jgi:competence protein ComEC